MDTATLTAMIRDVPDFPQPGVVFKDITPLIGSPAGLAAAVDAMVAASPSAVDVVVGMEARGFIFAAPVALALGAGFVPVRKPGKLPGAHTTTFYDLEYGSAELAVHNDAFLRGARVLIVDDVLATGGTVAATARLVNELGGRLQQVTVLMELAFLGARARLREAGVDAVRSVVTVDAP
jgi:adenine phosphoribosyltransferase